MNLWKVFLKEDTPVLQFAFSEFQRLMQLLDPKACIQASDSPNQGVSLAISPHCLDVKKPLLDDGYQIHIHDCNGHIEGTNERSVLLGVYRFFCEAGCTFAHPGRSGEIIPSQDSSSLCVDVCDCAAYRHRGLCIEGSNSFENVVEIIDYLPKIGCNSYFIQFFNPYEFFDRWYRHEDNPFYTPTPIGRQSVAAFLEDYKKELRMRGLIYHGVGHGWTTRVLGISADGWYTVPDEQLPEEKRHWIACIGGRRAFFSSSPKQCGVPLNTNLCYSTPAVQEQMARVITEYCLTHPELQYVHIWLADDHNNQCECPSCQQLRPSDFYIEILNRTDEMLSQQRCTVHLVFLIYQDLLWPPLQTRFRHPERFTLMFAPITRTYTEHYTVKTGKMSAHERNRITLPNSVEDSLAYLDAWKQVFTGDSFLFDYHYMWDHFYDLGNCAIAHTLCKDIEALHSLGLNGFISCQITRSQFPTAWGLYAFGHALWKGPQFDEKKEKERYFSVCYGSLGKEILTYLEQLSVLSHPEFCRGENRFPQKTIIEDLTRIPSLTESLRSLISPHLLDTPSEFNSKWSFLWFHSYLADAQSQFVLACARGDDKETRLARSNFFNLIRKIETLCPAGMESREYLRTFRVLFRPGNKAQS